MTPPVISIQKEYKYQKESPHNRFGRLPDEEKREAVLEIADKPLVESLQSGHQEEGGRGGWLLCCHEERKREREKIISPLATDNVTHPLCWRLDVSLLAKMFEYGELKACEEEDWNNGLVLDGDSLLFIGSRR